MAQKHKEKIEIVKMYEGKTIFLTGSTGFLGKMMLEKLLRSCSSLKRIYVLVRSKKNKGIYERFEEIFSGPMWEPLKKIDADFKNKVFPIPGDLKLPDLGISEDNLRILRDEVNVIMHIGASVHFDLHIKWAAYMNVRAVTILVEIAKTMRNFEVFLHVSTAFSHAVRGFIDEKFYETPLNAKQLLNLVECLDEKKLSAITPQILGDWPNTYTFTKAIVENFLRDEAENIPIIICRPSIVNCAVSEPLPGWLDNLFGWGGMLLAGALGILHSFRGDEDKVSDGVPADYSINCMIVAVAEMCKNKFVFNSSDREIRRKQFTKIYNYCSSPQAPITLGKTLRIMRECNAEYPFNQAIRKDINPVRKHFLAHKLAAFFLHTIPAYLVDFILLAMGKEPKAVEIMSKVNKASDVLAYFTLRDWEFKNENVQQLWIDLNAEDRRIFPFSLENFDYVSYLFTFGQGIREYLAKDPLETLPQARKRRKFLQIIYYSTIVILTLIAFFLAKFLICVIW